MKASPGPNFTVLETNLAYLLVVFTGGYGKLRFFIGFPRTAEQKPSAYRRLMGFKGLNLDLF